MLQQTQVITVIPYFYRFIEHFPTVESLAKAPTDQVLALWSGLGYYARARNLHRAAQMICSDFDTRFPQTLDELITLPGVGRSTAGAIISQSFNQFGVILDGNVKRVLTRYLTLKPTPKQTMKQFENLLWAQAEYFTPKHPQSSRVGDYTQAIMDLGATICTRSKPKCGQCPLNKHCQAHLTQTQTSYPVKPAKKIKPTQQATWLVLLHQPKSQRKPTVLLSQRADKGIWGGLWSFPEYPLDNPSPTPLRVRSWLKKVQTLDLPEPCFDLTPLSKDVHVFTHFTLHYEAILITLSGKLPKVLASQKSKWYNPSEITKVGLPSPITKILNQVGFFS